MDWPTRLVLARAASGDAVGQPGAARTCARAAPRQANACSRQANADPR